MAPTLHSHQCEQLFRTLIFHWLKHAWPGGTDSRKVQGRRLSRPPTLWGGGDGSPPTHHTWTPRMGYLKAFPKTCPLHFQLLFELFRHRATGHGPPPTPFGGLF